MTIATPRHTGDTRTHGLALWTLAGIALLCGALILLLHVAAGTPADAMAAPPATSPGARISPTGEVDLSRQGITIDAAPAAAESDAPGASIGAYGS